MINNASWQVAGRLASSFGIMVVIMTAQVEMGISFLGD
jgi:hypothetical protein